MPRGKRGTGVTKMYWPETLDTIIDQYNNETDPDVREQLFRDNLDYPLDKMAENIINTFKFPYINGSFEETKQEVVSFLVINLHKYDSSVAKSFSYFSVIAKNYLIHLNDKSYKQEKRSIYLSDIQTDLHVPIDEVVDLQTPSEQDKDDFKEFIKIMIDYWDGNVHRFFKKKRDIDIASAVIELFRNAEKIENYNKKALYMMIREMTDCETNYITKVVQKMRDEVMSQLNQYRSEGEITDRENRFFTYSRR